MKKIIATSILLVGIAAGVNAQGVFTIDSSANHGDNATPTSTTGGLVFIQGVLDTATDINLQLLWSTSSSAVTGVLNMDPGAVNTVANTAWLASQGTGQGDISFNGNGTIVDQQGNAYAPGPAASTVIYCILEGWTGSDADYATASANAQLGVSGVYAGATSVFAVTLASAASPIYPDVSNMGSLNLVASAVPEPTSLALAGLGGFGMLMALRRKQA
jgi:hypothetical protein